MSWGNEGNVRYDQNMTSNIGYYLCATNNSAETYAICGINDSGIAVRSQGDFKVVGDSDLDGKLDVTKNSSETAAKITNTDNNGLALEVYGMVDFSRNGTLSKVTMNNNTSTGLALDVNGRVDVTFNTTATAFALTNTNPSGKALDVNGQVEITNNGNQSALTLNRDC